MFLVCGIALALGGDSACQFASNFPVDLDVDNGLTADFIFGKYREWTADLSPEQKQDLWYNTANTFYRL